MQEGGNGALLIDAGLTSEIESFALFENNSADILFAWLPEIC